MGPVAKVQGAKGGTGNPCRFRLSMGRTYLHGKAGSGGVFQSA